MWATKNVTIPYFEKKQEMRRMSNDKWLIWLKFKAEWTCWHRVTLWWTWWTSTFLRYDDVFNNYQDQVGWFGRDCCWQPVTGNWQLALPCSLHFWQWNEVGLLFAAKKVLSLLLSTINSSYTNLGGSCTEDTKQELIF